MKKVVKLTEEQIRQLFGSEFGEKFIKEAKAKKEEPQSLTDDELYQRAYNANKVKSYTPDKTGNYYSGFNNGTRVSKSFPGQPDAMTKMGMLGASDINNGNDVDFGREENSAILKHLVELNDGQPLGLIDALVVFHKIKNAGNKIVIDNKEVENFLNSLSITSILSNFVNFDCPDYVYKRLLSLTEDEIKAIDDEYGRDFSQWGRQCDGCGIKKWKTNVFPNAHDDTHINLEYMGGEKAYKGLNEEQDNIDFRQAEKNAKATKVQYEEYDVPFQIHHMNENPSDNSPLNLACLCPNCHAITGSYGKPKSGLGSEHFDFLSKYKNARTGGLIQYLTPDEQNALANAVAGDFESRRLSNSIYGLTDVSANTTEAEALTISPDSIKDTIFINAGLNPSEYKGDFVKSFNSLFKEIFDNAKKMFRSAYEKKLVNENSGDADLSQSINISDETEEDTVKAITGSSEMIKTRPPMEVKYEIKLSRNGYIQLIIFSGSEADFVDVNSNNPITLNRMFWIPNDGNGSGIASVRINEINRIKNQVLEMILNTFRPVFNSNKHYKFKTGFMRTKKGKEENGVELNKAALGRTVMQNGFANAIEREPNEKQTRKNIEISEIAKKLAEPNGQNNFPNQEILNQAMRDLGMKKISGAKRGKLAERIWELMQN